ncbi:glycosyl transferase family protein [Ketogulonicigenium robustum]|uniref:Glycosyl transferase family protein n=1 Tax=Ketogulonicigenium robustum TaxID=92947 RepID=A0A1W6P1P8_9RHOB|nr:glycosyltransferase family 25 protein [Ketogulonicigenium robustum]ARO15311.1 glycosyl transferase family protein [Ketogulonicigenium robustum]
MTSTNFPPIYVLSLPNADDRRSAVRAEFDRIGLKFTFIDAINGNEMAEQTFRKWYDQKTNRYAFKRPLSRGEIACALGHHGIWSRIANGPHPAALVCEDDIAPSPDLVDFLQRIATEPDVFADVIIKIDGAARTGEKIGSLGTTDLILTRHLPPLTVGYIIGRNAARKILSTIGPISRPIDMDLKHYWEHQIPIFITQPILAKPRETAESTLANGRDSTKRAPLLSRFARNALYQIRMKWGRMHSPYKNENKAIIDRLKSFLVAHP